MRSDSPAEDGHVRRLTYTAVVFVVKAYFLEPYNCSMHGDADGGKNRRQWFGLGTGLFFLSTCRVMGERGL